MVSKPPLYCGQRGIWLSTGGSGWLSGEAITLDCMKGLLPFSGYSLMDIRVRDIDGHESLVDLTERVLMWGKLCRSWMKIRGHRPKQAHS